MSWFELIIIAIYIFAAGAFVGRKVDRMLDERAKPEPIKPHPGTGRYQNAVPVEIANDAEKLS